MLYHWPDQDVYTKFFRPTATVDNWGDYRRMSGDLLLKLDNARELAGIPFVITSAFRANSTTSHGRGTGVDIRAHTSRNRFLIVQAALDVGFERIGVYDRHVHVDVDEESAQKVLWIGKSQ
jgi:hypothetical protein